MTHAIELSNVTKTFGAQVAVDRLDLAVAEGAVYGFIGPNGSGKTTTLRMILRIFYPDSGSVRVLGLDHGDAADDRIGYLPEERGLYKKMRIRELLAFHAALKGMNDARKSIDDWLDRLRMTDWADKRIDALSKGMAQKVQFVAAVVARPKLVILDEPFSGLDPVNMETLKDAVLSLRQHGTTVIFSTHDMDVAEKMCDTIFMIHKGKKVLDGTLESIQAQYGEDTIRVRAAGDPRDLARSAGLNGTFHDLPGVTRVNDYGRYTELRIAPGADPQVILRALTERSRIEHFEITRPSLRDIFYRIAGPTDAAKEAAHA